jgi:hypothetical protein
MKSRPGQGLTVISKKIRLKQNDHASRRTQRSPHTRREQHPSTLAARSTPSALTEPPIRPGPFPQPPHINLKNLRQPTAVGNPWHGDARPPKRHIALGHAE